MADTDTDTRAQLLALQARACARPTTRAELLELVEAWRATNWIAFHREIRADQPPYFHLYDLEIARGHFRRGGWSDPHFTRRPDLAEAARVFARAERAAATVRELQDLADPGWEPEGLAEAWAALHRIVRETRPELPSLGKLA